MPQLDFFALYKFLTNVYLLFSIFHLFLILFFIENVVVYYLWRSWKLYQHKKIYYKLADRVKISVSNKLRQIAKESSDNDK